MKILVSNEAFSAQIDYPKQFPPILNYMEGWNLDHIIRYCMCRDWNVKIKSKHWEWTERKAS